MNRNSPAAIALLSLALLLPTLATAEVETYKIDTVHSEVGFAVRHFVAKSAGRFDNFEGTISIDPKDPTTLSIDGIIDVTSVNTKNEKRDGHLRSPDFFDVEKHPQITFKSKKVKKKGEMLNVTGDLTLRGITKEVTLEVEILGFGADAMGGYRVGLEASGEISRKDFGVSWNKALDQGGFVLGDDVEIVILVEAARQ